MKDNKRSRACIIANALVKQGVSRSAAMLRAWRTVKQRVIHTKTAGVTRGNRQALLDRLTRYSAEDISITLNREPENTADRNAVQVIAAVRGKGSAVIGYLNRQLARQRLRLMLAIAPLLDKGKQVRAAFEEITGGHEYFLNYGLNVSISV